MKDLIFKKNVPLKDYTTYKIGGPAQYFFVAKTKEDLIGAIKKARELKLPIFVLGGGSNILVSDKGIQGLVIKLQISDFAPDKDKAHAGAGIAMFKLVKFAAENGFTGLEWATGMPGTIGGAIYGHAQAFGARISDIIKSVEVLDTKTLKTTTLSKEQCNFSLKNSIFKKNKNLLIISAVLEFKKAAIKEIKEGMDKILAYRKKRHPLAYSSAGSIFVNPETDKGVIPAGYLIEKAGLMGKRIGNAQISEIHANFIINLGDAKAEDVMALIKLAREKVEKTFGIKLEPEVQFVPHLSSTK